ncbi:MAG: hypothetical protein RIR51_1325 [Bacteroidota bacterium]
MNFRLFIISILILISAEINSQIFKDSVGRVMIEDVLNNMYDFKFIQAKKSIEKIKQNYPEHPVVDLLSAMIMEREFYPFEKNPGMLINYKIILERASKKTDKLSPGNEKLFFKLSSEGYLAGIDADLGNYITAITHAKNAYYSIIESSKLIEKEPEFLYTTGLYNYLREAYGDVHPAVKPFLVFFKSGNKELGIKELNLGFKKSLFTGNEAGFQLAYLYKKYENKPEKSLLLFAELHKKFPNNPIFLMQYIEVKILAENMDGIKELLNKFEKYDSPYYKAAFWLFNGLIDEKNGDLQNAEIAYLKSTKLPYEEKYTREYRGMAYLGLARINNKRGNAANKNKYLNLSKGHCEYKRNIKEINGLK